MSNRIITIPQIHDRSNRARIKTSIINLSKTMLRMITNPSAETTTMTNTINPNEITKKKGIKIKLTNRNPSKGNPSKTIANNQNRQMPSNREASRKSIGKIECKSKSMLQINWSLAGNARGNSIQIAYKSINPSARRSSSRRGNSSMPKISVSSPKSRKNSWNTEK